jgi:hypothetical protein
VLKHLLLASLYAQEGGWLQRVAGALLQGVSLGTLDAPTFAPATGYISFFTLVLYIGGLLMIMVTTHEDLMKPETTQIAQSELNQGLNV